MTVSIPMRAVATGALLLVLVLGSVAVCIGVPAGWMWIAGKIGPDADAAYVVAVTGAPLTMIGCFVALARIEAMYHRLRGRPGRRVLETTMLVFVPLALVALVVLWIVGDPGSEVAPPLSH